MRNAPDGFVVVPILIGLAVAGIVWIAQYGGGAPGHANAGAPNVTVATGAVTSSPPVGAQQGVKPVDVVAKN